MSKLLAQTARKRFGQNFLIDAQVIDAIIASVGAKTSDRLVEIGPGHGAITAGLFASGCDLTLIELDRDLIPGLLASFVSKAPERCRLISQDVLKVDFDPLGPALRVVGNLPYNISTPLLFKLIALGEQVSDIHVMLQQEVVKRICAEPSHGAYGRLGVMIQASCDVEALIEVPPEAFAPAPKVHSGVVRITPNPAKAAAIKDPDMLTRLVRTAFAQRRKTLRNNLKEWPHAIALEDFGIDPGARPETLPVETYVTLANALATQETD